MAFSTKVNPRGRGLYRGSIGGQDDRKEEGGGQKRRVAKEGCRRVNL